MKSMKKTFLMALLATSLVVGCKKDEPSPTEDNELITTIRLKFTESGTTTSFTFKDLDGPGGKAPVIDKISLKPNKTYMVALEILDESKMSIVNTTDDIQSKKDEHIFEFISTPATLLMVTPTDKDSRGFNVGLVASAMTTSAGTGKLQVVLHHQPPVGGKPIKNGSFTLGSTDVDVSFEVEIK